MQTLRQYIRRSRKHMIFLKSDEKDEDADSDYDIDQYATGGVTASVKSPNDSDDKSPTVDNVAYSCHAIRSPNR